MQWQKAKTILIIVFFLINVFLLSYLFYDSHGTDSRRVSDLTAVLARNGVQLQLDSLPDVGEAVFVPGFSNPVLSEKLAGFLMIAPVKTENGGYTNPDKTCLLEWQENVFSYENQAPNEKKFKNLTAKNAVSKLKPYLKALGIEDLVYPVDISEIQGDTVVDFQYRVDERKLFGSKLSFTLCPDGVKKIRGFLGVPDSKNGFSYSLSRLETILLSLKPPEAEGLEITGMELGYYFINYTDAMISQAIPVYQIRTSRGEVLLDARDGVPREEREIRQIR